MSYRPVTPERSDAGAFGSQGSHGSQGRGSHGHGRPVVRHSYPVLDEVSPRLTPWSHRRSEGFATMGEHTTPTKRHSRLSFLDTSEADHLRLPLSSSPHSLAATSPHYPARAVVRTPFYGGFSDIQQASQQQVLQPQQFSQFPPQLQPQLQPQQKHFSQPHTSRRESLQTVLPTVYSTYQPPYALKSSLSQPPTPTTQTTHIPQGYYVSYRPPKPPSFRHVRSRGELVPVNVQHPKYRRALPDGGFLSPLLALTTNIASTYHICDPKYSYHLSRNPRRVLTEPREPKLNHGYDNEGSDYILWVNDVLGTEENRRYLVLNVLGKGTFGQVVKCQNMVSKEVVAVKVIKNKSAYFNQSMMEASVLEYVQQRVDKYDQHNLLRLKDHFMHKGHLCLVFELLSLNLYEVIKKNQFRGLSIKLVRIFATQLLDSLAVLKNAQLIHCDLKPENVLLKRHDSTAIKIIDFGSACHERQTVYTYIQSRFYRSPEVILGLQYNSSIDMWSLGCIIAELFLGLPIFPGTSEYNQWFRIVSSLGNPPNWMIERGKNSAKFMKKYTDEFGQRRFRVRTLEEQVAEFGTEEKLGKQYFSSTDIREVFMTYPLMRKELSPAEVEREMHQREALVDFVLGLLVLNPLERWTPQQAAMHPFITGKPFTAPFKPGAMEADANVSPFPSQRLPQQPPQQSVGRTHGQSPYTSNGRSQPYRRARAATIGQPDPVPGAMQRVAALAQPMHAIRTQPSPAYIPPPEVYREFDMDAV